MDATGTLDEALDRLHRSGPERLGRLTNHAPMAAEALVARGQVVKSGRTLTVARAEVYADDGRHVATMQQTLMTLPGTPDTPE